MIGTLPHWSWNRSIAERPSMPGRRTSSTIDVGPLLLSTRQRLLGRRRGDHLVAQAFAEPRESPADRLLIIDH